MDGFCCWLLWTLALSWRTNYSQIQESKRYSVAHCWCHFMISIRKPQENLSLIMAYQIMESGELVHSCLIRSRQNWESYIWDHSYTIAIGEQWFHVQYFFNQLILGYIRPMPISIILLLNEIGQLSSFGSDIVNPLAKPLMFAMLIFSCVIGIRIIRYKPL